MQNQFFIIDGRYSDRDFQTMIVGTGFVKGPFASYEDARQAWRQSIYRSGSDAQSRCTIVKNATTPAVSHTA